MGDVFTREYVCKEGHRADLPGDAAHHKAAVRETKCPVCGAAWLWTIPEAVNNHQAGKQLTKQVNESGAP